MSNPATSSSPSRTVFSVGNGHSWESIPVSLFVREVQFISLKGDGIFQQNANGTAEITAEIEKFVNQRSALGWKIVDGRIFIGED